MDSANYIPLGVRGNAPSDAPSERQGKMIGGVFIEGKVVGDKIIGETQEDRKRIAREIRQAAKKEHKKFKQDAKKARKLNGIMHRRATRNNEKYVKNKDRNRQRAIDQERHRIRTEAIHQAERLAAKHDPTGKIFNVGEVVVFPDGKVKSKEAIRRGEEQRARNAAEAARKKEEEAQRALEKAARKEKTASGEPVVPEGVNPQRIGLIELPDSPKKKISKTQQKRLEMLAPKPVPPKPVIPESFSVPEDEENFLALWDITDEDIEKRLGEQKRKKKDAAKNLRRIQKEQKKFNRAMKVLKKRAAKAGIIWDPVKAKAQVLGMFEEEEAEKDSNDSDSNSGSDSDSDSSSDSENEDSPKKAKSTDGGSEAGKSTKKIPQFSRPRLDLTLLEKAAQIEQARQEKKMQAKLKRRADRRKAEEDAKKAAEAQAQKDVEEAAKKSSEELKDANKEKPSKKKRKRRDDEDPDVALEEKVHDDEEKKARRLKKAKVEVEDPVVSTVEEPRKEKKDKSKKRKADIEEEVNDTTKELKKEKKHKSKKSKVKGEEAEATPKAIIKEKSHKKKDKSDKPLDSSAEAPALTESNDDKLDRDIAQREARLKVENSKKVHGEKPNGFRQSADQWNPDALQGGDARKDKFLRLLGAGKNVSKDGENKDGRDKKHEKKGARKAEEIAKVENELERQFESGLKMKEAGGKRRGLGA